MPFVNEPVNNVLRLLWLIDFPPKSSSASVNAQFTGKANITDAVDDNDDDDGDDDAQSRRRGKRESA